MTGTPAFQTTPLPSPKPASARVVPLRHGSGDNGLRGESRAQLANLGVWVALAPIAMLFLAFGSAFVVRRGLGQEWLPVVLPTLVWVNTGVLLASSFTLEMGRRALRRGRPDGIWIVATLGLGLAFLVGQVVAWMQWNSVGVDVTTTAYSSFFYVLTAAHAVHLILGVAGLGAGAAWPRKDGWGSVSRTGALRVIAVYWHFMDLVWIGVLLLLVLGR